MVEWLGEELGKAANHLQERPVLRRASILDQKVCKFGFCYVFAIRQVRFVQNEDTLAVPTEPPAIAVFALMDLALVARGHEKLPPANQLNRKPFLTAARLGWLCVPQCDSPS
jgi:hypothetical protein